jgi:hypothetical protein
MNLRTSKYAACAPLSGFASLEVFGPFDWSGMKLGVGKLRLFENIIENIDGSTSDIESSSIDI